MKFTNLVAALLVVLTGTASGIESGTTLQGWSYVSGGVSHEELQALHARRDQFSLWVITAAKRSGAYLADVRLKVSDSNKRVVFDSRLYGPWLFLDLPIGPYELEASFEGETQKKVTTIHPGDHHQALFYFNVKSEVSPEAEKPFPDNPFGNGKK